MANAKSYSRRKIINNAIITIINFYLIYVLGFTKFGEMIEKSIYDNQFYEKILYFLITIFFIFLINQVFNYFADYKLEKYFNLSTQSLKCWLKKNLKLLFIIEILGIFLLLMIHTLILNLEDSWWIYIFFLLFLLNIILGIIAPVIIFPIFYKFTKLEDSEIKFKIIDLCNRNNFKINGVYKFDMSRDTKKANAAFTGLGKSKRIILADTLLEQLNDNEIIAVFAHEIGHFKEKHILKIMSLSTLILLIAFYLTSYYNFQSPNRLANSYIVIFFVSIIQTAASVVENYFSRKYEFEADSYAKNILGYGKSLLSALYKLKKQNLADSDPHWLIETLFHSHPNIKKRIEKLKEGE